MQECHVSFEKLRDADSKVTELEAEKKGLQVALDAKDEQLKEEVGKKADLATDLEEVTTEVDRLNDEVDKQVRLIVDLVTIMNQQKVEYESALEEQKAEFKSVLGRQKAELEEKF